MRRRVKDSMGEIAVEEGRKWGASTQRSFENFKIGTEKMPPEVAQSLTLITGLRIMEQFVRDTVGTPPTKDKQH